MTLGLALCLEWLLGDPPSRWHPVAWFGRWAAWCERRLYGDSLIRGALAWLLAVLPVMGVLTLLWLAIGWPVGVLLLWLAIGWRSLFAHVRAVLEAETPEEARAAVARIVSRDSGGMTRRDAERAALESLAENGSDAVVAPIFWFLVAGPPGAALYRMINTLDAMWGYRTPRYRHFGTVAARLDDAANWLPARLTALLYLVVGRWVAWRTVAAQAASHASPNAGWPEVALAFAAGVRLGGPVVRSGCREERPWYGARGSADAGGGEAALRVARRALVLAALLVALCQAVGAGVG